MACKNLDAHTSKDKAKPTSTTFKEKERALENVYPSIFNLILSVQYENITIYTIEHRRASMGKQTLTPICRGVLKIFVSLVPYFVFVSVHCISICLTYVNFVLLSNIVTYFISC